MGELVDRIGLRMLVDGDGLADAFKQNSLYFYDKYNKSDKQVTSINISSIIPGMFYHFEYLDDSNWMKWSPVFVSDFKKVGNKIVFFAVNFNFIPLEVRALIFDKYMIEENFEKNTPLEVSYTGVYDELRRNGFEYSLVEYDASLLNKVHRIHMETVPRFLISQHPKNKYDPKALFNIWKVKIDNRDKRNQEMMKLSTDDFFNFRKEISDKYEVLKKHIQRIHNNQKKYGNQ